MFDIVFSSILTVIFFSSVGSIFIRAKKLNFEYYTKLLVYGCIILSFTSLLINFFFPLSKNLNSLILFLSLFLLYIKNECFLKKEFLFFLIVTSLIITLLLFGSHTYRPDAGLYHFPYIRILNEEKIIIGLSNLHYRFGHISIIQYLSAINYNLILGINGIVFPSAIIACAVSVNFAYHITNYLKLKNFNFHFFYLFGVFIYICFKLNRYGEYGNDAPTHFLTFFLISEVLYLNFKIKTKEAIILFNLSIFIILNKVTMFFVIFLPFIFLKQVNQKKIYKNLKTYFAIFFGIIWLLKNILISGCLIFPISFTCMESLSWSDTQKVKDISLENEAFSKNWPNYKERFKNNQSYYVSDFNWVKTWLKKQTRHKEILLPYAFILIFVCFALYLKSKKSSLNLRNNHKLLILILTLALLLWFVKIPTYRYGYSIIVSILSLMFASFCFRRKKYNSEYFKKFYLVIFICFISIFFIRNSVRLIQTKYYVNYPFPKFYSHKDENIKSLNYSSKKVNGVILFRENDGFCMYDKPLCTPYDFNISIEKFDKYLIFRKN